MRYIACLFLLAVAQAAIIHIPDEQPTIQAGIDTASAGDTVLVHPGTYVENINFNGNNIVVGSLFLTTGDTAYISGTIIDGDSSGTIVSFRNGEDSTVALCGLTITNGAGYGGGIYCYKSSPRLEHLSINGNRATGPGGGIACLQANPDINNVNVSNNTSGNCGGGIYCYDSDPIISNTTVQGNRADEGAGVYCVGESSPRLTNVIVSGNTAVWAGGGFYCNNSTPSCSNVTISGNTAGGHGGGLYFDKNGSMNFDQIQRCNIYFNHARLGKELYLYTLWYDPSPGLTVTVDTFTVMNPTVFHVFPADSFALDILYAKVEQVESDLYVSPTGDDNNSGETSTESLQSISRALSKTVADSLQPRTIYLADGVYSPSTTGENLPLHLTSYVSLSGISEEGTLIDGENQYGVLHLYESRGTTIENLTITGGYYGDGGGIRMDNSDASVVNVTLSGNKEGGIVCWYSNLSLTAVTITDNTNDLWGGGVDCSESSLNLDDVTIRGNTASENGGGVNMQYSEANIRNVRFLENTALYGGGLACYESQLHLEDAIIEGNSAGASGGGIACRETSAVIRNTTISNNTANWFGGGLSCSYFVHARLVNVILEGNSTVLDGGGLFCYLSDPLCVNATFSGNSADRGGGVFAGFDSHPNLINSILWNNTPEEIYIDGGAVDATYSDIQGHWEGMGNISAEPLFIDPAGGDFRLQAGSPCSDAGDPNAFYNEPDGTISDMGRYGGSGLTINYSTIRFDTLQLGLADTVELEISNYRDSAFVLDSLALTETPHYSLLHKDPFEVPPDSTLSLPLIFHPQSGGNLEATMVLYSNGFYSADHAEIALSGTGAIPTELKENRSTLPHKLALHQNFPNPFNPVSTIRYDLPKGSDVSLIVYDILGREVTKLVDSYMEPGYHQTTWNGRDSNGLELPSGIYTVRLTTPGYSKSIKMVLLK